MRIEYILTQKEINAATERCLQLKRLALLSRDTGEKEDNREFYLRAKGFEEALTILGIKVR